MTDGATPECFLITGVMAAGKSTVAEALARRYYRSVHLRGDVFRTMIMSGRDPIVQPIGHEGRRQLELRRRLAAHAAGEYWRAGFTVVLQDIYVGHDLDDVVGRIEAHPLYVVVLHPRPEVVATRERGRDKTGYTGWDVDELCAIFDRATPRIGLWLDTSEQSPGDTVEAILARRPEAALVRAPPGR